MQDTILLLPKYSLVLHISKPNLQNLKLRVLNRVLNGSSYLLSSKASQEASIADCPPHIWWKGVDRTNDVFIQHYSGVYSHKEDASQQFIVKPIVQKLKKTLRSVNFRIFCEYMLNYALI